MVAILEAVKIKSGQVAKSDRGHHQQESVENQEQVFYDR